MKRHVGNGRTFYRILVTLLSCVFIMAGFNWALMTYQNRRSVEIHTDMLANAMENGADQVDGFSGFPERQRAADSAVKSAHAESAAQLRGAARGHSEYGFLSCQRRLRQGYIYLPL